MQATSVLLATAFFGLALFASSNVSAEEPWGLSLLDDDTLIGWDQREHLEGWTIDRGILKGSDESSTLLAGWRFADFELRLQWSASESAAVVLAFPVVDYSYDSLAVRNSQVLVTLMLCEGSRCAELRTGDELVHAGVELPTSDAGRHFASIRRQGSAIAVSVDGAELYSCECPLPARCGLIAVLEGQVAIESLRVLEPAGESLVAPNSLDGWWTPGNLESWKVEGDTIACLNRDGNYLRTEKEYGDFTLSLEYKMAAGGNSGIGIRTPRDGWPSGDGIELQLLDESPDAPLTRHSTMALYGNLEPIARADRSAEWNSVVVKADQGIVSAWVNGVLVQYADLQRMLELQHRRPNGWIGFQDHGAPVSFRNVRIYVPPPALEPLNFFSPDYGYDDDFSSGVPTLADWTVRSLVRPTQLAPASHIESLLPGPMGVQRATVVGPTRTVLAELAGPGALMRIARSNDEGRLFFYFDDEPGPRIECTAAELHAVAPRLCDDQNPLITCLPFAKLLRVELAGAQSVEYRLDYIRFSESPTGLPPEREAVLSRGMAPALTYRSEQFGWGVHREHDEYERVDPPPQSVPAGGSRTLLSLRGTRTLEWFKLRIPPEFLADDRLWLEVRVDGDEQPTISAPARYLFPGLAGSNYPNFTQTDRNGYTSFLPLRCYFNIEFTAVNRGETDLENVALSASADGDSHPMFGPGVEPVARLHGIFQTAEETRDGVLIEAAGRGRLIGFVYEPPPEGGTAIESLTVDGAEQPGWADDNMDLLLGMAPGETEARKALSGRYGGLEWVYLLLTPVDFQQSLVLKAPAGAKIGNRLALLYME